MAPKNNTSTKMMKIIVFGLLRNRSVRRSMGEAEASENIRRRCRNQYTAKPWGWTAAKVPDKLVLAGGSAVRTGSELVNQL